MSEYFDFLLAAKKRVVKELKARGIESHYLQFGGVGPVIGRVFTPTDARSEFLANRAMGDWAENLIAEAVNASVRGFKVVHYGNSDRMSAGENGFKEFYRAGLEDVRLYGKRPDILIVPDTYSGATDVSGVSTQELRSLVESSVAAVEVRSSKFEALHYMRVRAEEKSTTKSGGLSFTVKVEDLKIVYRWIENFKKPQAYCQVFFDSMFAINVLKIFEIIGSGIGYRIETPAKSQEKATIMIPITSGTQIATYDEIPSFTVEHRKTRLGRHDAYVRPVGGTVRFEPDAFLKVLEGIEPSNKLQRRLF